MALSGRPDIPTDTVYTKINCMFLPIFHHRRLLLCTFVMCLGLTAYSNIRYNTGKVLIEVTQTVTIHLFIMTQNDQSVGVVTDAETINRLSTQIKQDLAEEGVKINIHTLHDESFSLSAFARQLPDYNIGTDDVVWFYYSGHGRNYDAWPQTHDSETPLTGLHEVLKGTNARLVVTMFDCCNWDVNLIKPLTVPFCDGGPFFEKLFLQSKGDVMVCAAKPGKFAFGRPGTGSLFTNSFASAASCTGSWLDWLQQARNKTMLMAENLTKEQEPIFLFSDDFQDGTYR